MYFLFCWAHSGSLLSSALLGEISLIWIGHISLDRMLGYGLNLNSFRFTHIQSAAKPVIVPDSSHAQEA